VYFSYWLIRQVSVEYFICMLLDSGIVIFDLAKIFYLRVLTDCKIRLNKIFSFIRFGILTTIIPVTPLKGYR